ncbi:MAG: hypothetical protein ACFFC7_33765, partial [Candidatus Hermodarchaeota archaeon]
MTDQGSEHNLISKKRELVITTRTENWSRYIRNKRYKPILDSLSNGPLLIDEIREFYQQKALEPQKSASTIYRYLKELIKVGLVIEAGRRVFPNQSSTKILYDLTASLFIASNPEPEFWTTERGTRVIKSIGYLVQRYFEGKQPSVLQLSKAYAKFEQDSYNLFYNLMQEIVQNEKTDEIAKKIIHNIKDLKKGPGCFFLLSKILWVIQRKDMKRIIAKLDSCFNDDPQELPSMTNEQETNIETEKSQRTYHDVITYVPNLHQVVDQEIMNRYIESYNHRTTRILLNTPKTLKDIHKEHHQAVLEILKKDQFYQNIDPKKVRGIKEKKEKTIYKYLTDLKEMGLIVEAGRRITPGRSVAEILYAKKAFYVRGESNNDDLYKDEDWKRLVHVIGLVIQYFLKAKNVN